MVHISCMKEWMYRDKGGGNKAFVVVIVGLFVFLLGDPEGENNDLRFRT